jgi:hypothetical protein
MDSTQETAPRRRVPRLQFSLRLLLGLTAAISLLFGMIAWRGEAGAFWFFLGAGVVLTAVGVYLRRMRVILAGVVTVAAMFYGLVFSAERTRMTGGGAVWQTDVVCVRVVDAATGEPVAGASVSVRSRSDVPVDEVPTGPDGVADVVCHLPMIVSSYRTLFGNRGEGWISYEGVTVRAQAEGYRAVRRPLIECFDGPPDGLGPPPPATVRLERLPEEAGETEGRRAEEG